MSRANGVLFIQWKREKHLKQNKALANYFLAHLEKDSVLGPEVRNPVDGVQHRTIRAAADCKLSTVEDNGLSDTDTLYLDQAVTDFIDVFLVLFCARPLVNIISLKNELT